MKYKAIFLDFDGVIVDSMGLKFETYCFALKSIGALASKDADTKSIKAMQLKYAGKSRQLTLPLMYQDLTQKEMPEDLYQKALKHFTEHDEASRKQMKLFPGAYDFLSFFYQKVPLAIVTGTPQEVINKTLSYLDIGSLFQKVCGTPPDKISHIETLLKEMNLSAKNVLFVGDAIHDYRAAKAHQMDFAGIDQGDHPFQEGPCEFEVTSLKELQEKLLNL